MDRDIDELINGPSKASGKNHPRYKAHVDWEWIEREYRVNRLTLRQIADSQGISQTRIHQVANEKGWIRDLSQRVRTETAAQLIAPLSEKSEENAVQLAAARSVQVVREHRESIQRGQRLATKLFTELEASTEANEEIVEDIGAETKKDQYPNRRNRMLASVSLPGRAQTLNTLATSIRILIGLERQAFNLSEDNLPPGRPVEAVRDDMSAAEALAAYQASREAP